MKEIITMEQYNEAITNGKVMLYFTTKWCPDCFFINPHLPAIEEKYNQYTFYKIDRDNLIPLCQDLDILGIPSFVAFEDGKEIGRFVSKLRKTKAEVEAFIDSL